jgi:hypothetical protein
MQVLQQATFKKLQPVAPCVLASVFFDVLAFDNV